MLWVVASYAVYLCDSMIAICITRNHAELVVTIHEKTALSFVKHAMP